MEEIKNTANQLMGNIFDVAPGVWGMKDKFVNFYMIANPDGSWVLVDTGLKTSKDKIDKMSSKLFGGAKPACIILTHGHFDHIGALEALLEEWNVPTYAHYLEIPYLTGKSSYPPPDPTVGGGLMSLSAFMYPNSPINIWNKIEILPEDGVLPSLPGWKYFHTPGHAPGHISLFREEDGVLIAGDAFVTTKQESAISVMLQLKKLSGPPKYFTYDWTQARQSVKTLMKLEPEVVASGHGKPMHGKELRRSLHHLSEKFNDIAVPSRGRYVNDPAVADATGIIYIPPTNINPRKLIIKALAVTAALSISYVLLYSKINKKNKNKQVLSYEIW